MLEDLRLRRLASYLRRCFEIDRTSNYSSETIEVNAEWAGNELGGRGSDGEFEFIMWKSPLTGGNWTHTDSQNTCPRSERPQSQRIVALQKAPVAFLG